MATIHELYKDLNKHFADKNPQELPDDLKTVYAEIMQQIANELKTHSQNPSNEEYEIFLKVSTKEYQDLFADTLKKMPPEERKSFIINLQSINNRYQQEKEVINQMADLLKSVPARLEAIENIENTIKEDKLNPVIKTILTEMLKDKTLKDQLDEKKLSAILKVGTELSANQEEPNPKSLSEQFIDKLLEQNLIDENTENKLLEISINTEKNEQQIIATDADEKAQIEAAHLAKEEAERLAQKAEEEAENREQALKDLEEKANDENTHSVVKDFFNAILQDDELKKDLSVEDIKNFSWLSSIDKNTNDADVIDHIKYSVAYTNSTQTDKIFDVVTNIEETYKATEEERAYVLDTINQFKYENPPKIRTQSAYALLTCDNPAAALINVDDLYAVATAVNKGKEKLPDDAIDIFQQVLKSRLENLREGDILPSNAKAYLELCSQCEDANIAASTRNLIADAMIKYDKQHFGALNPDPNDLASVYNYAKKTLDNIDVFKLPVQPNEADLSKLQILDEQGNPFSNKDTEELKKRLTELAREMAAREVVARKGTVSTDELNQIYKASVAQILLNAQPDSTKYQTQKIYAVKATALAHSLAVQTNKMEEFNFRAKQKWYNHPWVKTLTSSLNTIDKKLENNKTIGKAYKIAKPVLKFLGKTAISSAKTAAIFGVAGLVPGGTGILLAYYGGKNIKQAAQAVVDKNLTWKQKIGKVAFHSVSATLSLVGAAQGLEAGSELLKNAGFEGISNVMHGAGEIINKGVGLVGQGATAVIAHTANLLSGAQDFHSIPAESISATLGSISPYGRFAIMGTMMSAPNVMKGTKMKFQSWRLKRKIENETDPIKLQALVMRQQQLHDQQLDNLKDMSLKLGSSALGMFISSKLTPLAGNLIHDTASAVVTEAKETVTEESSTAKNIHLTSVDEQINSNSGESKGLMASPRENPETNTETKQSSTPQNNQHHATSHTHTPSNTEVSHTAATAAAQSLDNASSDTANSTYQSSVHSGGNATEATMEALKAAGVKGVDVTYGEDGTPTIQIIKEEPVTEVVTDNTSTKTNTSTPTETLTQTQVQTEPPAQPNQEKVLIMDEATGEMIEVPAEPETTVATDEVPTQTKATDELKDAQAARMEALLNQTKAAFAGVEGVKVEAVTINIDSSGNISEVHSNTSQTSTTSVTASDENASQQVTVQGSEAKQIKVLGFDGKEIAIPTTRADAPASITLYQGYNEVNNYNINHATKDGILTPDVYNGLKAQGVVTSEQLHQYISAHPDALHASGNASSTITGNINSASQTTANEETAANAVNNAEASSHNADTIKQTTTEPNNSPAPESKSDVDEQIIEQAPVVTEHVFTNPYEEEDFLLENNFVHARGLNHNLRNDAAICILEPKFHTPGQPEMCLVIEPEPHIDPQTGQPTFVREVLRAELEGQIRGSHGNAGYYTTERWNSHNIRDVHGIGVPVAHTHNAVDEVFHTIRSGIRLVDAVSDLGHSIKNLFGGGHSHHDAPPPPHGHRGGR